MNCFFGYKPQEKKVETKKKKPNPNLYIIATDALKVEQFISDDTFGVKIHNDRYLTWSDITSHVKSPNKTYYISFLLLDGIYPIDAISYSEEMKCFGHVNLEFYEEAKNQIEEAILNGVNREEDFIYEWMSEDQKDYIISQVIKVRENAKTL